MLGNLMHEEMIQIKTEVKDWEEAIRTAAIPLLERDFITEPYVETVIKNVKDLGPYIVIVPNVAIPHARPEDGVNRLGMSMLCLRHPVAFSSKVEHLVQLIIMLAPADNEAHLKLLSQLVAFLSNEEKVQKVLRASTPEEIASILSDIK